MNKRIGKIVATSLGYEDHGLFTAYLTMDYGGSGQGVGGYSLDRYDKANDRRVGTRAGHDFIIGVLRACGVDSWEKVRGRTVFVLMESDAFQAKPIGLENLPTEPGERFLFAPWLRRRSRKNAEQAGRHCHRGG